MYFSNHPAPPHPTTRKKKSVYQKIHTEKHECQKIKKGRGKKEGKKKRKKKDKKKRKDNARPKYSLATDKMIAAATN